MTTKDGLRKDRPEGSTYVAANGYEYTKVNGAWVLTHRHLMEQHLGRPLLPEERVVFKDNDRTNLTLDNLEIRIKSGARKTLERRIAELDAKIEDLQHRRAELQAQLKEVQK